MTSSVKNFLKYLKAYSLIPIKVTKKFEGDQKINVNWKMDNQALDLKKNMELEVNESLAEIQKPLQYSSQYLF